MMRCGSGPGHPLTGCPGVNVSYRSIASECDIETGSSVGDSESSRRVKKPRLVFGKAWSRSANWHRASKRGGKPPRLVDRDAMFSQSFGRWNIRRLKKVADIKKLIESDPFHTLVNQATSKIIFGLLALYLTIVTAFALVYYLISATLGCNLELGSIRQAYLFSQETMSTVGYGTSDYLFGDCWVMLPMLSAQACMGLLIDAFLIGILFARLSRPQTRACTVVFSKNAVIRRVRGEAYFMFQVGELRKHQLLETRVRCYALRHERISLSDEEMGKKKAPADPEAGGYVGTSPADFAAKPQDHVYFQCHNMRLQHPDDELGGNLILVLPQTIVHRIDAWSPMMPPPRWNSSHGMIQWGLHQDKDIVRAPWDEGQKDDDQIERQDSGAKSDNDHKDTSYASPKSSYDVDARDSLAKADSNYWEVSSPSNRGDEWGRDSAKHDSSVGYVYRFPDLLKRWDDVDGDRGTWYEVMKRRMLRVEMDRREKEKRKARKAMIEEASSAASLAAARRGRPPFAGLKRRSTIMHIEAGSDSPRAPYEQRGETDSLAEPSREDSISKPRGMNPRISTARCDDQGTVAEDAEAATAEGETPGSGDAEPSSPPRPSSSVPGCARGAGGPSGPLAWASCPSPPVHSPRQWFAREERKAIDVFLQDRELEVVVILEGTDTCTGNTVQARHSYCWEDILWDRTFASCVFRGEDGACVVDFSKFHDTLQAPEDCVEHGFVQSFA